jgi:hypothetical protein
MDDLDKQIRSHNGLSYPASEELSLANAHRLRYFPALRDSYAAGTSGYVDISVGSDLICGPSSWIEFGIAIAGAEGATATLPENGAMAVFRETIARARSGQELDRYQYANICNYDSMPLECTYGTAQTVSTAMGPGKTIVAVTPQSGAPLTVCVPLAWVNPFFSSSRLIPTQSIGTIRLEMLFAPAVEALIGEGVSYFIQNLNVVVDTFSLSDAALRSLSMIAANSGLAYEWPSMHCTVNTSNGSAATFVSLKSASRALSCSMHISRTADLTDPAVESVANETFQVAQSQFSLGSQYLPVRPITTEPSHYLNVLAAADSLQHCREFAPQLSLESFLADHGTIGCTLERSSVLQSNGQATSSSRPLIAEVLWKDAEQRTTFMFLKYQRLLLCYSDSNLVLKE